MGSTDWQASWSYRGRCQQDSSRLFTSGGMAKEAVVYDVRKLRTMILMYTTAPTDAPCELPSSLGAQRLLTTLACRANLPGSGDYPRKSVLFFAWSRVQRLLPVVGSLILAVAK